MTKVNRLLMPLFSCLMAACFLVLPASAATQGGHATKHFVAQPCEHLLVHLRGSASPLTTCLDSVPASNSVRHPASISITCDDYSLVLYWDANFSGPTLCFSGSGWANLTDYCAPIYLGGCLQNWNDKTSSFISHDTPGAFYKDINLQNYMFNFAVFTEVNLISPYNDVISSLAVQSCAPNDNPNETADSFISRCLRGSIRQQFPSQLLGWTLAQIFACAKTGDKACQTARKLLTDSRFRK
jgi:hypothetical protein